MLQPRYYNSWWMMTMDLQEMAGIIETQCANNSHNDAFVVACIDTLFALWDAWKAIGNLEVAINDV